MVVGSLLLRQNEIETLSVLSKFLQMFQLNVKRQLYLLAPLLSLFSLYNSVYLTKRQIADSMCNPV
ncbi:hypothetical protein VCRA2120O55_120051 [Vibrio crassostreae]|nr:hypothetical protein VCRA2120O55_120051 [Vibrio crassostreae]